MTHLRLEPQVKLADLRLAVAEEKGRHQQQARRARRVGLASQRQRAIQRRVGDSRQHRHAAALHRQVDQAHAVVEVQVDELARRAEQGDPLHSRRAQKIDQL